MTSIPQPPKPHPKPLPPTEPVPPDPPPTNPIPQIPERRAQELICTERSMPWPRWLETS
jgi:hypothetical protein